MKTENDLIKERNARRAMKKALWDETVDLSITQPESEAIVLKTTSSGNGYHRLLDEKYLVDSDGNPFLYLTKGVAKSLYESVDSNYKGFINLGHQDYASFPLPIGNWSKKDLKVVKASEGHYALEVKPDFDTESVLIRELQRLGNELALSIEMNVTYDWSDEGYGKTGVPTVTSAKMLGYALVGEPGNVGSANLELATEGVKEMSKPLDTILSSLGMKKQETVVEASVTEPDDKVTLSVEEFNAFKAISEKAEELKLTVEAYEEALPIVNEELKRLRTENEELNSTVAAYKEAELKMNAVTAEAEKKNSMMNDIFKSFAIDTQHSLKTTQERAKENMVEVNLKNKKIEIEPITDDGIGGDLSGLC